MGILEPLDRDSVVLLSLLVVKLQVGHLAFLLLLLVLLPVLDALGLPFFHEASVSLQLVDLDAPQVLLFQSLLLFLCRQSVRCDLRLTLLLFCKLIEMRVHVDLLLRLIKRRKPVFKELMLLAVVLLTGLGDLLGWLVVAKLACL